MGKRTRKTRWRTLPIGDEHSESEESNSTLDTRIPPSYHHQKYYNARFTYSSQSTPTRRYQSDGTKSTRSSSTASENKITFNEDEYTRITTPRQDVLFKKGYLNKPKTYSTQTSTGNSTTSTGNSTGNGTPDYQSTDLDYESPHFVYSNGFLDQNGIYYVNGYDPYTLMVYNPTSTYYSTDANYRTKKYSTESLTETTSETNEESGGGGGGEEVVIQNGGGEETHNATPQINDHPQPHHMPPPPAEYGPVYNVVYPGFYYNNGLCPPPPPPRDPVNGHEEQFVPKRIKKRRRRKAEECGNETATEYTEDELSSTEEEPDQKETSTSEKQSEEQIVTVGDCANHTNPPESHKSDSNITENTADNQLILSDNSKDVGERKSKYDLKPDAQEFVPRSLHPETLQYFKIAPNFVPVPVLSPLSAQNYNPSYLPPGVPVNFIQPNHPVYQGFLPGYVPTNYQQDQIPPPTNGELSQNVEPAQEIKNKCDIDIRTVVSKLEEVANESPKQENGEPNGTPYRRSDERKKPIPKNKQNSYYQRKSIGQYQSRFNGNEKKQEEQDNANKSLNEKEETITVPPVQKVETPHSSPKVKQNIPINSDVKKAWPRKDDNRVITKKDQTVQHPDYSNYKYNRKFNPSSPIKKSPLITATNGDRKYSETLKKTPTVIKENIPEKKIENIQEFEIKQNVENNKTQWISVSSKKKRKNKNFEDTEIVVEELIEKPEEPKEITEPILNEPPVIKILEVRDLEKELLNNAGVEVKIEEPTATKIEKEVEIKSKPTSKKKTKKSNVKNTKRVIITDVDLSENQPSEDKEETTIETPVENSQAAPPPTEEIVPPKIDEQTIQTETADKKSKKKKKKQTKTTEATTGAAEDTYDFLLENTFTDSSHDKTNMEISHELDLIIQRGMYSGLEQKIKSLNIMPLKEEFFQTIARSTSRESSVEKSPEFTKLLASSMPKFKYSMASVDDSKLPSLDLNQPSTSKIGLFVEDHAGKPIKPSLPKDSFVANVIVAQAAPRDNQKEKFYPITEAVKNWMTKTRETTPEVEILKSPSVILKELREQSVEDNGNKRNGRISESDEDITVYSASRKGSDDTVDLLDCWDSEMSAGKFGRHDNESKTDDEDEDDLSLEVYESKYGQNTDFLELQKEIEDKLKQDDRVGSRNFPKHGALPYRAICCSIM